MKHEIMATSIRIFKGNIALRSTYENVGESCVSCPSETLGLPFTGQEKILVSSCPVGQDTLTIASSCPVLVSASYHKQI